MDFGFWILDFGFWSLEFGFWILDFGFWILDLGFWILDFGSWILDFGFWILDFGFWILDFGFWISDFGFWILDCRSIRSLCGSPKRGRLDFGFWILDLGFWILDLGFWILDFGSWILDFGFWILDLGFWIWDLGFWILDFGFWILDFVFTERFGFCIRLLLLHADSGRRIFGHFAGFSPMLKLRRSTQISKNQFKGHKKQGRLVPVAGAVHTHALDGLVAVRLGPRRVRVVGCKMGKNGDIVSDTKNAIDTTMPQTAAMATRSFGWEPYSRCSQKMSRLPRQLTG